jgi:ABC-2 type transport system permease protein
MNFFTAFQKEFLEQRRTKRLLIAVTILVLFGITSPLMAKMMPTVFAMIPGAEAIATIIPTPTMMDAVAQYLKNITQFGVMLALLYGMGSVALEKDKGTAIMILSKPMPRGSFLMAKFAAIAVTFVIALVLAGGLGYFYTVYLFGPMNIAGWIIMNGLVLLYLLLYTALTLFFSTLTKTQYIAIGLAFGALIILGILGSIPGIGKFMPDALIANAGQIAIGGTAASWVGLWVTLALIFAALLGAWIVFRRQEI